MTICRLNWGSGETPLQGWYNSDRRDLGQGGLLPPGHVGDILDGLPWPDEFFDSIVAHHAIDMLDFYELPMALVELHRVLHNDGTLRISVPNIVAGFDAWLQRDRDWFPVSQPGGASVHERFCLWLSWYGTRRSFFTAEYLTTLLGAAGFRKVSVITREGETTGSDPAITSLDTRWTESLFMEATR